MTKVGIKIFVNWYSSYVILFLGHSHLHTEKKCGQKNNYDHSRPNISKVCPKHASETPCSVSHPQFHCFLDHKLANSLILFLTSKKSSKKHRT